MAQDKPQNLQDTFLNHVRKNKVPLTVFLVNGVKLQGVISWFDNFCVLLRRDGLVPARLQARHLHHHARPAGQPLRDEERHWTTDRANWPHRTGSAKATAPPSSCHPATQGRARVRAPPEARLDEAVGLAARHRSGYARRA